MPVARACSPPRKRMLSRCLPLLAAAAVLAGLLHASHARSRHSADALVAKIPARLEFQSERFCPIHSLAERWGPSWEFSYESAASYGVDPLTLKTSLTGEVIATNPRAALAEMRTRP